MPPELRDCSEAERKLVSPLLLNGVIRVFRGRKLNRNTGVGQFALKGHSYSVKLDTAEVERKILPHTEAQTPLRVYVSGPKKCVDLVNLNRYVLVRRARVEALLKFSQENNELVYKDYLRDSDRLNALPENAHSTYMLEVDTSSTDGEEECTAARPDSISGAHGSNEAATLTMGPMTATTYVAPVDLDGAGILRSAEAKANDATDNDDSDSEASGTKESEDSESPHEKLFHVQASKTYRTHVT